jgi:hypothetical protein
MQNDLREAVERLTKDVATVKSFSANAATFYDGPNKRYIGDVAADIETVLALLSARPLALGGQQGERPDFVDAVDQFLSDAEENGSIEVDDVSGDCIAWNKPGLAQTLRKTLRECGYEIVEASK